MCCFVSWYVKVLLSVYFMCDVRLSHIKLNFDLATDDPAILLYQLISRLLHVHKVAIIMYEWENH